jgi:hypothetical protein
MSNPSSSNARDTSAGNAHRDDKSGPVPRQLIVGVELFVVRQGAAAQYLNCSDGQESV